MRKSLFTKGKLRKHAATALILQQLLCPLSVEAQDYNEVISGNVATDTTNGYNVSPRVSGEIDYIFSQDSTINGFLDNSDQTSGGQYPLSTEVYGVSHSSSGARHIVINNGNNKLNINIDVKGPTYTLAPSGQTSYVRGYGVYASVDKEVNIDGNLHININAEGKQGMATGQSTARTEAFGLYAYDGFSGTSTPPLITVGDNNSFIVKAASETTTSLTHWADTRLYAYSVYATGNGAIQIGDNNYFSATALGNLDSTPAVSEIPRPEVFAAGINGRNIEVGDNNVIYAEARGGSNNSTNTVPNSYSGAQSATHARGIHYIKSLGNNNEITAKAYGVELSSAEQAEARDSTHAAGIQASNSTIGNTNNINVEAYGGNSYSRDANAIAGTTSYGIFSEGVSSIGNDLNINVFAQGGSSTSDNAAASASTTAAGINNYRDLTVGDKVTIYAKAVGGEAQGATATANTSVYGAWGNSGNLTFTGDLSILVEGEAGTVNGTTPGEIKLYALYAGPDSGSGYTSSININQAGGKTIQLTGDINANFQGDNRINLNLDNDQSYWRPVSKGSFDASFGPNGGLEMSNGGLLDLAWLNNKDVVNGNYTYNTDSKRHLSINGGVNSHIGDGAVFRMNSDIANKSADRVTFTDVGSTSGTNYLQVAYDPIILTLDPNYRAVVESETDIPVLIYNSQGQLDNTVAAQSMTVDTPLYTYTFKPLIRTENVDYYYYKSQTTYITGLELEGPEPPPIDPPPIDPPPVDPPPVDPPPIDPPPIDPPPIDPPPVDPRPVDPVIPPTPADKLSETPKTASDAQAGLRNVWLAELNNMMRRMGDLRMKGPNSDAGLWTRGYGGKMKGDSAYGRSFSQEYSGFEIGYDRELEYDKGVYYLGVFANHITARPHYERGSGKAKNTGIGIYSSFLNDKGHYLDLVARLSKLRNRYDLHDMSNNYIEADYKSWAYGFSAEYGYRGDLDNDWFYEPQAELIFGRIGSNSYTTSNGVRIRQGSINTVTGRAGVLLGKYFGRNNNANAYIKGSIIHDFSSKGSLNASYNGFSEKLETACTKGTAFEFIAGANVKMSEKNDFYFEFTKTFGGDINTDWQVNAGLRFNF